MWSCGRSLPSLQPSPEPRAHGLGRHRAALTGSGTAAHPELPSRHHVSGSAKPWTWGDAAPCRGPTPVSKCQGQIFVRLREPLRVQVRRQAAASGAGVRRRFRSSPHRPRVSKSTFSCTARRRPGRSCTRGALAALLRDPQALHPAADPWSVHRGGCSP